MPPVAPELVFRIASTVAALAWLLLALSPYRASWSARARGIAGLAVPLLLAVAYVALFAANGMGGGGYGSLDEVRRLMAVPGLLTAGWLHYLAFDLFVGSWIAERGGAMGMPHPLIVVLLGLTFMFGPAGLLAFCLLRRFWRSRDPISQP